MKEPRGVPVEALASEFYGEDEKGQRIDYEQAWEILRKYPAFNPVSGGMKNIEVTKKGVSKKTGLAWVGKQLGVSPEEMMALGDSGNDGDMLRYAADWALPWECRRNGCGSACRWDRQE
ncbi:MAG: HAD family hydrolase [Eubacterium sp.]